MRTEYGDWQYISRNAARVTQFSVLFRIFFHHDLQ